MAYLLVVVVVDMDLMILVLYLVYGILISLLQILLFAEEEFLGKNFYLFLFDRHCAVILFTVYYYQRNK